MGILTAINIWIPISSKTQCCLKHSLQVVLSFGTLSVFLNYYLDFIGYLTLLNCLSLKSFCVEIPWSIGPKFLSGF